MCRASLSNREGDALFKELLYDREHVEMNKSTNAGGGGEEAMLETCFRMLLSHYCTAIDTQPSVYEVMQSLLFISTFLYFPDSATISTSNI